MQLGAPNTVISEYAMSTPTINAPALKELWMAEQRTYASFTLAEQLTVFFCAVCQRTGAPPIKPAANQVRDGAVARKLRRDYTLPDLKPLLVYYVFDWTDDKVSKYGRTLLTFQKNVAIIREEFDDVRMAAPNYAANKLKEYGLPDWSKVKNLEGDGTAKKRARSDAVIKAYNEHLYGPEEEYDSDVVDAESDEEAA